MTTLFQLYVFLLIPYNLSKYCIFVPISHFVALLLFDCENHLILGIIIKIIILNIISVISIVSMVNNMTAPVAENIAETAKQTIKTDVVESQQLLGPTGKVSIQHNGELYQLRQTRTGKLILTK